MDDRDALAAQVWTTPRELRQHDRMKLSVVEENVSQAKAALERARVAAGDHPCRKPILDLAVKAQALDIELLVEVERLHD